MTRSKRGAVEPLGAPSLRRLLLMCIATGVVAGLGATIFFIALEAGTHYVLGELAHYHAAPPGLEKNPFSAEEEEEPATPIEPIRWLLLVLPAAGGLLSGWIVFRYAPEAEGHGTDAAIEAYHFKDGKVRARVPWIKAISSALTIGTGGSGGREGPIAQIGSGFGSILGGWLKVRPEERRILMDAGMAAGVGAIFHAPLAGALFGAEVLYRGPDMEHEVLLPAFVTSVVAYSVFGSAFGFHPLFLLNGPGYSFTNAASLIPFAALGVVCALGARLYVKSFYGARHIFFHRLRKLPNHIKPAIGGLLTGMVGFFLPEALGTGYGVLQACFNMDAGTSPDLFSLPSGHVLLGAVPAGMEPILVAAVLLLVIGLAKIATTAFSIGSGGSGGVFGPAVVIGGAFGGAFGLLVAHFFPGIPLLPGAYALVGMAGFFAGAAHTPISTIIMVSEMTGNYDLLVPAMLVCLISFLLCRDFTLYEKQLPGRLDAPSKVGHMARAILRRVTVGDAIALQPPQPLTVVPENATFDQVVAAYTRSSQSCFPVVDEAGAMTGLIEVDDIRVLITETAMSNLVIAGDLEVAAATVTPGETVLAAINTMVRAGRGTVVVVDPDDDRKPVATLSRGDIITAYNQAVAESGAPIISGK